jgi:hypothetical protein
MRSEGAEKNWLEARAEADYHPPMTGGDPRILLAAIAAGVMAALTRPPYGVHNPNIDRVATDLGYATVTLWSGTIGDSLPDAEVNLNDMFA